MLGTGLVGGGSGVHYLSEYGAYVYMHTYIVPSQHIYSFRAEIPEPVAPAELQELVATDNSVLEQFLDESRKMQVHEHKQSAGLSILHSPLSALP